MPICTMAEMKITGRRANIACVVGEGSGCVAQRGGKKYLALTNDNEFFHMAEDRFDSNVDVDIVCSYASAFRELVLSLSNK